MRRFTCAFALAGCVALFVAAPTALAHPDGKGGDRARGPARAGKCVPKRHKEDLARFDLDKNGRLDRDEHRKMRVARHQEALAKYDKNGDGRLDRKERGNLRYDLMVSHFEELDGDHDAEISRVEVEGSCTPLEHDFDRIDTDGNGLISWAEFEAGAKHGPPRHGPPPFGPPPHGPPPGPGYGPDGGADGADAAGPAPDSAHGGECDRQHHPPGRE